MDEAYDPVWDREIDQLGRKLKAKVFRRTSTAAIMGTAFPPIRWIVPGYLAEGLAILAGRQKLGKTWLGLDWAIAVASGGVAMGSISCVLGDVLFVDLENGHRRIQRRIEALLPDERNRPDLSRLEWVTEAPALNDGFIGALDEWRNSVASPRLVIVDVLQRIKPIPKGNQNAYESDYSALAELQQWATRNGIGVLVLHHTRKGGADDPLEALSGSNGLSACADTTLVLDRDANGVTLYVRGRDVEERESALDFTGGFWTLKGDASDVRRTTERRAILDALADSSEEMTPQDIASAADMKRNNVDRLLGKMAKAGEVKRVSRGRYQLSDRDPTALPPGTNGSKVRNPGDTSYHPTDRTGGLTGRPEFGGLS
ncbi:AAA family ATPase [Mesorhizobium sp.]|uniref:AAA family ATPase n=1 Tax=Mesorhizobium sp. TaxID=1871066 RepID=UPI000FD33855|nr:AAA family ATPase [Mesorhizobium sp.]RVC57684.1 recombinase A [Mesorhizobium sp. M4B.F.Ca.ET.088.02.2.1]RWF32426.1 MAG: recombinase A [Mesorhizobium sp.]